MTDTGEMRLMPMNKAGHDAIKLAMEEYGLGAMLELMGGSKLPEWDELLKLPPEEDLEWIPSEEGDIRHGCLEIDEDDNPTGLSMLCSVCNMECRFGDMEYPEIKSKAEGVNECTCHEDAVFKEELCPKCFKEVEGAKGGVEGQQTEYYPYRGRME